MSKTTDPTSDELQSATEPEKKPGEYAEDQFMFTIKGHINQDPDIEWSDDGSEFTWSFELDEVDINFNTEPGKPGKVVLRGKRPRAYFMWGKIDSELVKELQRFEQAGEPSDRLDEVRRSLGIPDGDPDL